MKSKDIPRLPERICRALDLPTDILPHRVSIELSGQSYAKICGAGAILLYSPTEIRIAIPRQSHRYIALRGHGLGCASYNVGAIGIEGRISSLSFEEED